MSLLKAEGRRLKADGRRLKAEAWVAGSRAIREWPLRSAITALAGLCVLTALAYGQQMPRDPEIGYAYPAGARQGSEVQVTVGGQALGGSEAVFVTGKGVTGAVLGYKRPLTIGEANRLRERIQEAYKKLTGDERPVEVRFGNIMALRAAATEAGVTDEQLRALDEFRRTRTDPKRQLNPQLAETVSLKLTVAPDAEPGVREIRIRTVLGLTNPVRFVVGTLPEVAEVEPNDRLPDTCAGDAMPIVINGQIMPGDVDKIAFEARKGMRVVVSVSARELIPYMADAVPGWFQAVAAVYDPDGREVAYADDFRLGPDPALCFQPAKDGRYVLEVRDSIYRGREDFVYRVTIGELPFVTGVFPLGARVGGPAPVQLTGWNLPASNAVVDARSKGTAPVSVSGSVGPPAAIAVDDLPETLEKEPNGTVAHAQHVTAPTIVNGRIGKPGDADVFAVEGRKGTRLVVEVLARRLGSPVDSCVVVTDARGRRIAANDDWEDRGAGLTTHHADSRVMADLPASGTYYVRLTDAQANGGPEHAYRLRISPPRPDFELRLAPSSVAVRAGAAVPVTVCALRRDGFDGDIELALKDAPAGFVLAGGRIPSGTDKVRVTLTASPREPIEPLALAMEGIATIGGSEVRREARPCQDMMQAFAYQHLVPSQEWLVAVTGRYWGGAAPPAPPTVPVRIPMGESVRVAVPRIGGPMARQVGLELNDAPAGVTVERYEMRLTGGFVVLRADPQKAKAGTKGNLIVDAYMVRGGQDAPAAGRPAQNRRAPLGCLPAIPFEIVAKAP